MDGITAFKRLQLLRSGSHAKIFLAAAPSKQSFVVKTAPINNADHLRFEEDLLKRFDDCNGIIKCLGSSETSDDQGQCFNLFLEYALKGNLADFISFGRALKDYMAKGFTKAVLEGLSKIHKEGIVHAHLNPKHILLFHIKEDLHHVKITDFGSCKASNDERVECMPAVSCYNPPEFDREGEGQIVPPFDIWSVGCIVLRMLHGSIPFLDEQKLIPDMPPTLSEEARDFLGKCFISDPQARWTADMLLGHPFLHEAPSQQETPLPPHAQPEDKSSATSEQNNNSM